MEHLRSSFPQAHITLFSEKASEDWNVPSQLLGLIDEFYPYDFRSAPHALMLRADVIIQAPGGGLQDPADPRGASMLSDAEFANKNGIPYIFSGHSFHPSYDLSALRHAFVLAREPASHALLTSRNISSVLSADPAFLLDVSFVRHSEKVGTLLFFRRWHFRDIKREGNTLITDGRMTIIPADPLCFASSDPLRDDTLLQPLQQTFGIPYRGYTDLHALLSGIASSKHVITDRYHPAIFAAMLGTPYTLLPKEGSLRDQGLLEECSTYSVVELSRRAKEGMNALTMHIQSLLS